ncbi:hypothetical protein CYANOKiyG1_34560 [Okeania sp. KiyG1]|nr:hypothetical protein CYANOKiyG1_34560 [Okeania sp. KiyG1]
MCIRQTAVVELGICWQHDPETIAIIKKVAMSDRSFYVRQTALELFALLGKNDPCAVIMLKKLAESDDNFYVRRSAIQQLALGWHDEPEMFEFFCDRAYCDPFVREEEWEDNPRQTALEAIIEQYQGNTQIFQILSDRTENDLDEQVQKFALKILKGF